MKEWTDMKKHKKLIIALIILIAFQFCYPLRAKALIEFEDLEALPAKIFFLLEKGALRFLNDIFTADLYDSKNVKMEEEDASADTDGQYIYEETKVFLTPENIIKGKFIIFDADIFKEISADNNYYDYEINEAKNGRRHCCKRKGKTKRNGSWLVLCFKKFSNCGIALRFGICGNSNDFIDHCTR